MTDLNIANMGDNIAKNIRRLLKDREMTNKDLAEKIGVSRPTISNLTNGRGSKSAFWMMTEIAKEFGITIEELYKEG